MLRSTSLRLAASCAAAVLVATLATLAVVWLASASFERRTFQDAITADVTELVALYNRAGVFGLARGLDARAASDTTGRAFWWLADARDQRVAGNLRSAPRLDGWQTIAVPERDGRPPLRVLGYGLELPGALFLYSARDTLELERLEQGITRALLASAGASVLFALGVGWLVAKGIARRVAAMNAALASVAAGDVTRRLPGADVPDEFGRLAASTNATLARLDAAMRGLKRVSGDLAHDLRTPLSRLRNRLDAALASARSEADWQAAVERAIADTDEVLEIFAAILRIAEVESGARQAGFAELDLSAALADIAEAFQEEADETGHRLDSALEPGVVIRGDRALLQQAGANLLANAVRHTPGGTQVRLALRRAGAAIVIEVADDGPGVSEADRARLATPFLRLEESRNTQGHGLGLALVRAVAELHGGRLEFSDAAPGLVARISLPG
ncbi:MAG: HAMP domain-containing protein [Acetobacteraceae bacterium]|nr:HAMP domain-containing protein [Acetobacteraceae bacterium]